jgi:diaminopimelate decarboxylase
VVIIPYVDGFEVSSGGELRHVTKVVSEMPVAFGGPRIITGKE